MPEQNEDYNDISFEIVSEYADIEKQKQKLREEYGELYKEVISQRINFAVGLSRNHVRLLAKLKEFGLSPEIEDEALDTLMYMAEENAKFLEALKELLIA